MKFLLRLLFPSLWRPRKMTTEEKVLLRWLINREDNLVPYISASHASDLDPISDIVETANCLRRQGLIDTDKTCWSPTLKGRSAILNE